jgi:uncharacterized protein (TIGR03083 family)
MTVMHLARAERVDLLALLTDLEPHQWDVPTLCAGWRVRDLVAHVIGYEGLGRRELARRFVRGRFNPARINGTRLAEFRDAGPDELLALLEQRLEPSGLTTAFGGHIALLDAMIHQQDIRRPLGAMRTIPAERLLPALAFARIAPPIGAFWRARGLRLVATDLDWSAGRGPEVRGPAEPMLMAISGRQGVVDELTGPGTAALAVRLAAERG